MPVLLEPLRKIVWPIVLFFYPDAGPLNSFYFLLVMLWTICTWALFGGAITRIAAVQVARREKIGHVRGRRASRSARWLSLRDGAAVPAGCSCFLLLFMSCSASST